MGGFLTSISQVSYCFPQSCSSAIRLALYFGIASMISLGPRRISSWIFGEINRRACAR